MSDIRKGLVLVELNEINFDLVAAYLHQDPLRFPALRQLLTQCKVRTKSEDCYDNLEPWIQWVSVHTGKSFSEHKIFRLGDIVGSGVPQIFEQLEAAGYSVGTVAAMNVENRLKTPAYFIPDPWTNTPSDSSLFSRGLGEAISQAVNDNSSSRITLRSALSLIWALCRFAKASHYWRYLSLLLRSVRRPWHKAMFLDLLLHDVHSGLYRRCRPNFSAIFFNAGAHIQHHYLLNAMPLRKKGASSNPEWYVSSQDDPVADVLDLYDLIVAEYFSRSDVEVVLATGLSQKPYDRNKFYYRLKSHDQFLRKLGISFLSVKPRMTRDFLIEFGSEKDSMEASAILASVRVGDSTPLFGEIDNRGTSLFVTLTYPDEIISSTMYECRGKVGELLPEVSFVAIKNGMHQADGFAFFSAGIGRYSPADGAHVSELATSILEYFEVPSTLRGAT